jgi:hypothetical protein
MGEVRSVGKNQPSSRRSSRNKEKTRMTGTPSPREEDALNNAEMREIS